MDLADGGVGTCISDTEMHQVLLNRGASWRALELAKKFLLPGHDTFIVLVVVREQFLETTSFSSFVGMNAECLMHQTLHRNSPSRIGNISIRRCDRPDFASPA